MQSMAEKKPSASGDEGRSNRKGVPLNVYIRKRYERAIRAFLAQSKPRPTKTSVVETALDEFFTSRGFPVPTDEDE